MRVRSDSLNHSGAFR